MEEEVEEEEVEDKAMPDVDPALTEAAEEWAGGPGAFYLGDGDFSRLVGPAPAEGLGDANDMVNLEGLERESYLFDSQYYKDLVEKATFTNPTGMTYSGDPIEIQFAWINRTVAPCELWANFFKPQVEARTNGKVLVPVASFPELGIAGPDSLEQVTNGTLSWAEITSGYVSGHMPEAELAIMYGVYPDHEVEFKVTQAIGPELDRLFEENTDGGKVLTHMWVSGGDQFFFRFPMQPSALLARASTRMQSVCSFSKAAMRHPFSGSRRRKGLGTDVQSAARYWMSRGSTTCSISSLLHSPSASMMAFASYRNASIRLWER